MNKLQLGTHAGGSRHASSATFGAGRCWRETLKCATRANACADRRPTSAPSRAGAFIWLYGEPQDCSNASAAGECARLMHHLLPSRFRRLPVERPACASRSSGDADAPLPVARNRPELLSPKPAGCARASCTSASAPRTVSAFNSLPIRLSPLVSGALGEAARQLSAHRRTSTPYPNSESTHDPRSSPGAQSSHRQSRRRPRRPSAVLPGRKRPS